MVALRLATRLASDRCVSLHLGRERDFRTFSVAAARAAADKKAEGVVVLDVRRDSDVADFMVIAGAQSSAQMRAIHDHVASVLRALGMRVIRQEGRASDRWMALDYGGMVMHILLTEARAFYRLEHLWEKARPVAWAENGLPKRKKRSRP